VVVDYIIKMKTTFDINLDLYVAFKQNGCNKNMDLKRSCQLKKLLFIYL